MDSSLHLVPERYKLPTAPGGSLREDGPGWEKAENKFTATSGLPACVCVCVSVSPTYMHVCFLLLDHRSTACMCVHLREHTCNVNKNEPICSAKFEYSLRVCGYVKANVYVIVRDLYAMLEKREMVSDACKTQCV